MSHSSYYCRILSYGNYCTFPAMMVNLSMTSSKKPTFPKIIKAGAQMLGNEDYHKIFHEIKNSITLIGGSLQLLSQKHPEVCGLDHWDDAMSEIGFLKNMVTQLSMARLSSHLNLSHVNIYNFMGHIASSVRAFSWDNFDCAFTMGDNLPLVEMDLQLMKQAIINIIKNAYEASEDGGTADIQVFFGEGHLHISITDKGGGLDPSIADSVFQPFITSKTGGTGLGLAITRQIVESHHGTLTYVSRPSDGCTFTISLPPKQS